MAAIKLCEDEIADLDTELVDLIRQVPDRTGSDRFEFVQQVQHRLKRMFKLIKGYRTEVLEFGDKVKIASYQQRINDLFARANDLQGKLDKAKKEVVVSEPSKTTDIGDSRAPNEMWSRAAQLQDDSLDRLANSKRLLRHSEDVGKDTFRALQDQSEGLNRVHTAIKGLEDKLQEANTEMGAISKRLKQDKIAMCLGVCIIMTVAFIIAMTAKEGGAPTQPDAIE